jgi:uncharacterized membrane protein YsdA (DUF1294 family)
LFILLALPALALRHFDWRFVVTYAVLISSATYLLYRHDKKRAQEGGWRVSESTLHLFELLGGWAGAFLAQRTLRHKNAKRSYQVVFWLIVALHQYAALDSLTGWRCARRVAALL